MFTISPCTRRAAQCLAVVCGLATMSMALPAWADRPSTAVTVVNPTTSPVPATVVNPTDSPVPTTDVNNPALQPFQINLLPHSPTSSQATDTYTVPAGKRLVIEYYSSQAQDISGGAAGLTLLTTSRGKTGSDS